MALKLTAYEQEMLDGKHGEAKQLAMKIMVKIGEPLGAEELVEVVSVQAMAHFGSLHIAGRDYLGKLACMGGKCCVPTTQDPASIPFDTWEEMGYDKEYAENQMKLCDSIMKLGEYHAWSCTPYVQGSVPRLGQNVAWAESSAVSYANSVLGARTNRTPAGLAVCAALTGRIPKFGLYFPENRKAQVKVNIDAGPLSDLDYNTIGIIIGKRVATGKASWLLPWAIFLLAFAVSATGAGPAPAIAIVALPALSLAIEMGVSPFLFGVMTCLGSDCGASSPISTAGIVAQGLVEDFGWPALQPIFLLNSIIGHIVVAIAAYLLLRGWKVRPQKALNPAEIPKFNRNQIITLIGIAVFVVLGAVLGRNIGMVALIVGLVLIMLKVGPTDKAVIKDMAWNTLLLICGVSVLMNVVVETGGIDLMVTFLSSIMTPATANPIMGLTAGIMSFFSTTTSVVMPTLIPTVPGVLENLNANIAPLTMLSSLVNCSFSAAISPLSAGGGIILATYVQLTKCNETEQAKMFRKLFLMAFFCVIVMVCVAAVGIYLG